MDFAWTHELDANQPSVLHAALRLCQLEKNDMLAEFVHATRQYVGFQHAMVLCGARQRAHGELVSPNSLSSVEARFVRLFNEGATLRGMFLGETSRVHAELCPADIPFNPSVAQLVDHGLRHLYVYELFRSPATQTFLLALDSRPSSLQQHNVDVLELLVAIVSRSLATSAALDERDDRVRELGRALSSRVVIEQAKGILAERMGLRPDEAFGHLRKMARDARVGIDITASQVVRSSGSRRNQRMNSATT